MVLGLKLLSLASVLSLAYGRVIDLTHIYGSDVMYPPVGPNKDNPEQMFNFTVLARGHSDISDTWLELNWFSMFEHGSTHIDAPSHFVQGRSRLHAVPADHLIGPGVMIDVTKKAEKDMNYLLSVADIEEFEEKHGPIPNGAIIMMNTGWHKRYPNRELFYGTKEPEDFRNHNHPGMHPDAAKWLMSNRQIKAVGVDTPSCDNGQNGGQYPTHVALLGNDVLVLEMVANLDVMPHQGSTVFLGAIKLRDASGGPTRILALIGDDETGGASGLHVMSSIFLSVIMFLTKMLTSY